MKDFLLLLSLFLFVFTVLGMGTKTLLKSMQLLGVFCGVVASGLCCQAVRQFICSEVRTYDMS
jgi:hypothetical protein